MSLCVCVSQLNGTERTYLVVNLVGKSSNCSFYDMCGSTIEVTFFGDWSPTYVNWIIVALVCSKWIHGSWGLNFKSFIFAFVSMIRFAIFNSQQRGQPMIMHDLLDVMNLTDPCMVDVITLWFYSLFFQG